MKVKPRKEKKPEIQNFNLKKTSQRDVGTMIGTYLGLKMEPPNPVVISSFSP